MKHPRLRSEKENPTMLGYEMGIFKSRRNKTCLLPGFSWLNPYLLGNSVKRKVRVGIENIPGFNKTSDGSDIFRIS